MNQKELNFILLSALSGFVVLMLYISPFTQVTFSLVPTTKINPGMINNLPKLGTIGPADPTPYNCTKDPNTGKGTCESIKGNVLDAFALYDDINKVCDGAVVIHKDHASCNMK
jgi:hypothetical protein